MKDNDHGKWTRDTLEEATHVRGMATCVREQSEGTQALAAGRMFPAALWRSVIRQ